MENYLFKKIYLILVRIGSLWHLGHSFPSPLFASKVLLSMCTTKNIRVPFLPSFQPGPMVSPQKEQAAGLSHPLPLHFIEALISDKQSRPDGLSLSSPTQPPLTGKTLYSRHRRPIILEVLEPSYTPGDEEEMATQSSNLAYRILWTEEPGGLLSMGSHRVGHN